MLENSEIIKNLERANLSLQVAKTPDAESILKIIEFIKTAERDSGRFTDVEKMIKNYTRGNCFDLAMLIKMVYEFSTDVKIVKLESLHEFCTTSSIYIVRHYVAEFNGYYYDINGKHTKAKLEEFCKKEFGWLGVKYSPAGETKQATWMHTFQYTAEEFHKFCLSKISACLHKLEDVSTTDTGTTA